MQIPILPVNANIYEPKNDKAKIRRMFSLTTPAGTLLGNSKGKTV